jgi:hypothetical protein
MAKRTTEAPRSKCYQQLISAGYVSNLLYIINRVKNRCLLVEREPPAVLNKPRCGDSAGKCPYSVKRNVRSKLLLRYPQLAHGGRVFGRLDHVLKIARLDTNVR